MLEILEDDYCPSQITPPFTKAHPIWIHNPISCDTTSWQLTGPHHNSLGLAIPNVNQPFTLADRAWYMLYHGRPGTPNQFIGMAFSYTFQVHYHSVFRFKLALALCPMSPSGQASFVHHFAGIIVIPGRSAEYLADLATQPPSIKPFISSSRTVTLTQMDLGERRGANLTIEEVLSTLAINHIPLAWVDHCREALPYMSMLVVVCT